MRPIVKAVGLICILAHDYLIVKLKMLFGYPVAIIDHELSVDTAPVLTASGPLFRYVLHSQIQHFEKAVISRKYGLCLSHFLQLTVETFFSFLSSCGNLKYVLRLGQFSYQDFEILGYLLSQVAAKESRASRAASSVAAV